MNKRIVMHNNGQTSTTHAFFLDKNNNRHLDQSNSTPFSMPNYSLKYTVINWIKTDHQGLLWSNKDSSKICHSTIILHHGLRKKPRRIKNRQHSGLHRRRIQCITIQKTIVFVDYEEKKRHFLHPVYVIKKYFYIFAT